jgi:hypothetical protein
MSIEQHQPRNELATTQDAAVHRLGEWAQAAQAAYSVAENLVRTSFVPEAFRGKPHEATAAILSGLEVGLSPMASLRSFDVIQGTAAPRAITLRAIVQSKGHDIDLIESTASRCVMEGTRKGSSKPQRVTWTLDRAKQLGLTGKPNWKNQPQAMLLARATSEVCRLVAADAILGIAYTAEEIADGGTYDAQAASEITAPSAPNGTRKMSRRPQTGGSEGSPAETSVAEGEAGSTPAGNPSESPLLNTSSTLAKRMFATMGDAGITERADRLAYASKILGREIGSSKDLTDADAELLISATQAALDEPFDVTGAELVED